MKRILWLLISGICLLGFAAGCGVGSDSEARESANEMDAVEEPVVDQGEDTDMSTEDPDAAVSNTAENNESSGEAEDSIATVEGGGGEDGQSPGYSGAEIMQKEVRFVGLADPHTIEVETDEGFMALQVDPGFAEKLEGLASDTVLTIEYYQNEHGQYVLTNYKVH